MHTFMTIVCVRAMASIGGHAGLAFTILVQFHWPFSMASATIKAVFAFDYGGMITDLPL